MARSKSTGTKQSATRNASVSPRRPGRPSKADIEQRQQSAQTHFIDGLVALASATMRTAIEGLVQEGGVTTIGSANRSNASSNQSASRSTSGSASTGSGTPAKRPPGRKADPESKLSKSREIYAANIGKLERNAIVDLMVSKLGIKKPVANTYYHTIHRGAGGASTRRSRSNGAAKKTGTNG